MMMPLRDFSVLAMVILLWGMNFIAVKLGVLDFPIWASLVFRLAIVAALLLPFCPFPRGQFKILLVLSLVLIQGNFAAMFEAIQLSPSTGMVAVIMQMAPAFAIILDFLFFREIPGIRRIIGLTISFVGVVIIFYDPLFFGATDAIVMTLLSALSFAVYTIIVRGVTLPPLTLICWTAVIGGTISLVLSLIFEPSLILVAQTASISAWGGIVFMALCGSILGHGAYAWLVQRQPVSLVLPFTLIIPVVPLVMGAILFDDPLTPRMIVGTAIILSGIAFILRSRAYVPR